MQKVKILKIIIERPNIWVLFAILLEKHLILFSEFEMVIKEVFIKVCDLIWNDTVIFYNNICQSEK